jgi:CheY-like chemotaxis protein
MPNELQKKTKGQTTANANLPGKAGQRQLLVMVVDDDREFREELQELLAGLDYAVVLDSGGKYSAKRIMRVRPDLVLLDLKMDKINGLQVAVDLAGLSGAIEPVPVIAMTGFYNPAEINRFMSLRVIRACLVKPFSAAELQAQIIRALRS